MQAYDLDINAKIPRVEYRAVIKFLVKQGKTPHEIHQQFIDSYGDQSPSYATIYRWHRDFTRGKISLNDDPHTGRIPDAITPQSIERVRNLIKDEHKVTIDYIAEQTNLSHGTIHTILHKHLHMRKICARWVPRNLSEVQRLIRHDLSQVLLQRYEQDPPNFELRLITCDESWLHHYDPETKRQSMEWVAPSNFRPHKARAQPSAGKVLLTVFWDSRGVILTDYLEQGHTVTGPYYAGLLRRLRDCVAQKRRGLLTRGVLLLQDNAPAHTSEVATRAARQCRFELLNHPPYSPDLSPCDYYLFPKLKYHLKGNRYDNDEQVIADAEDWFEHQPQEFYLRGIQALQHRWRKCIETYGDYVEKN